MRRAKDLEASHFQRIHEEDLYLSSAGLGRR
jgi:hypothetical protein